MTTATTGRKLLADRPRPVPALTLQVSAMPHFTRHQRADPPAKQQAASFACYAPGARDLWAGLLEKYTADAEAGFAPFPMF